MSKNGNSGKRIGRDLTQGSISQQLLLFSVPLMLSNALLQFYSMADLAIIGLFAGNVGTVAVSNGSEITDILTPFAMALATGGQIYISQLSGAKDEQGMREALGTMLSFMLVVSALVTIVPIIFCSTLLHAVNCPEEAFSQARDYMIICSLGMPFVFGYNAICGLLRGMGESKRPLLFVAVAATVNIALDILLVAVIPLEATGTAIATVASQIGSCIAAFVYLYKHKSAFDFELQPSYFKIRIKHLGVLLKLSIPQLTRTFCHRFSMLWVKSYINSYGMIYSATYSVGNKLEKFVDVFYTSLTTAGSAMIGQNLGARKIDRVKKVQNYTLLSSLAFGFLGAAVFVAIPKQLFCLFTVDVEVINYGVVYCRIMAVSCIVHSVASAYKCMATGAGEAALTLVIGVLDGVSRIIVCVIVVFGFHAGVHGFYWGSALCHLLPGFVSYMYYVSGKWKTKKLLSE